MDVPTLTWSDVTPHGLEYKHVSHLMSTELHIPFPSTIIFRLMTGKSENDSELSRNLGSKSVHYPQATPMRPIPD